MLDASAGPWIFASVALVVVAGLAYRLGRAGSRFDERSVEHSDELSNTLADTRPDAPASLPAIKPSRAALGTPAGAHRGPPGGAARGSRQAFAAPAPDADDGARGTAAPFADCAGDARAVLRFVGSAATRRLTHANAAARRLLHLPDGPAAGALDLAWPALESSAPAALRAALADPAHAAPWWLLREDPSAADGGAGADEAALLALGPAEDAHGELASLVYTVTHDLRAPVRVVDGFARIVKEDYGSQLDRVGRDHLDRVLAAAARMNQMIDAVLTMARLATQPLQRQPVDLSQAASFVVDELRKAAPERAADVVLQPGLRASGDPTLLRLVLENLLGNAWKYSARATRARIEFSAAPGADGRLVYCVRDNGAGFDMRVAERLFGLFQRLHSASDFPGTGVGLASVRRIVERHGGQIWAEAEPERGAAFYFTLAG